MGVTRLSLMLLLAALLQLSQVDAYSKYGRGCGDIGCLPNEECVITSDSCSYNQRDGKDCGSYPTCKRKSGASSGNTHQANPSSPSSAVNPSGSSLNTGPENNIFAPASSNPTLNTYTYFSHNSNNNNNGHHQNGGQSSGGNNGGSSSMGGQGGQGGQQNGGQGSQKGSQGGDAGGLGNSGAAGASATGIDPHYVFGAKHHMPIIPNMPIFPYNSPTQAPSFQQFPQPNHPGSVLNPGYPMHGLQPVNPYNPPFVFGQLPFYSGPAGTGGPPGGGGVGGGGANVGIGAGVGLPSSSMGILGGGGGGLAPYGSNYQGYQTHHTNANMYNKPPPQYQNQNQQNPYNRQTQARPSAAGRLSDAPQFGLITLFAVLLLLLNRMHNNNNNIYENIVSIGST
ncbi:RNA-binding protein FUS isoform X2 [Drosophila sulfurigaster albostrigata]|uniref:RNA-binding protein FUS isoform X2 n=1 Tax=Drosophila sulfurigaster albostrigata TaxID=89887 RepID=UPI002D21CECA|nr:RNA-binding protein FUS isoform X2 [Drosophila sulfurigaster albostrigata]